MTSRLRLACVVPWSSEFIWKRPALSMLQLSPPDDCEIAWFFSQGDGWCSARRHNSCLEQAKMWRADLVCILGADQVYPPDMLQKLIGHYRTGHEAVTAMVPIRGHVRGQGTRPFSHIIWRYIPDKDGNIIMGDRSRTELIRPEMGGLVEIHGCGSGVLLFPVAALDHVPPPWFTEVPAGPTFERKSCADWPFVHRLQRDAELKIWCDTTIRVRHVHPFEIDETFTERFADWEETGDPSLCHYGEDDVMIRQVRVSPSIPFYKEKFMVRHDLKDYATAFYPAFFFGCYNREDLQVILDHQSTAIIIWAGTDAQNMRKALEPLGKHPFGPHVRHVAISRFIAEDLDALGIPYKRLPLCNVDVDRFKPVPLGKAVYCYCPSHDREKYGGPLLDQVRDALPDVEFIVQETLDPNADMPAIYAKCAIGLRLTEHDGLSNTVVELGLMGRRCVWNGDTPNAIAWKDAYDIVGSIQAEFFLPNDPPAVAQKMRDYLTLPPDWKTVAFHVEHTKPAMKTMTSEIAEKPYDYRDYFDFRYSQGNSGAGGPTPGGKEAEWVCETIRKTVRREECSSVLEVGCGSMVRWKELPVPADRFIGIDVSPLAIEHARSAYPGADLRVLDVTKQDIPEADAVLCIDVLQHIRPEDFRLVLEKLFRAARKLVIIKTSVGIPTLHYQFDHEEEWRSRGISDGWCANYLLTPDSKVARFMVFVRNQELVAV